MISYFKVVARERRLAAKETPFYKAYPLLAKFDRSLRLKYLLRTPYTVASSFLKKQGSDNPYVYGETPLFTLDRLAKKVGLTHDDHVLELGAGRGRSLLFFHTVYGCSGVGYEWVPLFCKRANNVFERHNLPLTLKNKPLIQMEEEKVSVAYLYGCTFSDPLLFKLAERLTYMPQLKKVICISFPLSSYAPLGSFSKAKEVPVLFPWGRTTAYIQERV